MSVLFKNPLRLFSIFLLIAVQVVTANGVFADDPAEYELQLQYPGVVGERQLIKANYQQTLTMELQKDGKHLETQEQKNAIAFEIEVITHALSSKNTTSELDVKVLEATLTPSGQKPKAIVPANSEISIREMSTGLVYTDMKTEQQLTGLAASLLPNIVGPNGETTTLEEMFGPKQKRKVGEVWEGNKTEVAKFLKEKLQRFDEKNISAGAKFLGTSQVGDQTMLDYQVKIVAKTDNPLNPPPGTSPLEATISFTQTFKVPANGSTPPVVQTLDLVFEGKFTGNPGSPLAGHTLISKSEEHREAKVEWLEIPKGK